jgi:hypothetical protein
MVSEVTSDGTVKFCKASLLKPNVSVTVVGVVALAGVPKNAGATRVPAPTIEITLKTLKIRRTPICTHRRVKEDFLKTRVSPGNWATVAALSSCAGCTTQRLCGSCPVPQRRTCLCTPVDSIRDEWYEKWYE